MKKLIKENLRAGEKIVGVVADVTDNVVTIVTRENKHVLVTVSASVANVLDDLSDEIISLERIGKDYEVYTFDSWDDVDSDDGEKAE